MRMTSTIQFLGAAGTVTGSKHLVTSGGRRVLLDCGMFQGLKELRQRNWRPPVFDIESLDAVVLSHAHIDHSGHLPLIVRRGFEGPIHCTPGTAALLRVLLPDAAYLQEEHAAHANRHKYSKHAPAEPLYTVDDAYQTLELLRAHAYETSFSVADAFEVTFRRAGHILGSASVDLWDATSKRRIVFSGDLGRWDQPILCDPQTVAEADVLLLESTYGDREHPADPENHLERVVQEVARDGSTLLIPAFAVGRTQDIVWRIRQLEDAGRVPVVPVVIDSPMAIDVTRIYMRHPEDHDADMRDVIATGNHPLNSTQFEMARTVDASKALNVRRGPMIIISASGMATGGRILHHLKRWLPDPRTRLLLVGFQAAGTRGRALQDGAKQVRIHGQEIDVRAKVDTIDGLSAHADRTELRRWTRGFARPPRRTYLVHGEPRSSEALRETLASDGWDVEVATDLQKVSI